MRQSKQEASCYVIIVCLFLQNIGWFDLTSMKYDIIDHT